MALSEIQFQDWLESDSAIRCTLIEVQVNISGVETTLYFSNRNYITLPTDTPANIAYIPIVNTSLTYSESISLSGSPSLSYGDISLNNTNGEYDYLSDYVWAGRQISIFVGNPLDIRDNFTKIYSGIVEDIAFQDRSTINLSIRDMTQKLNTPMHSATVGGTGANKEALLPLLFGEVFNITPISINTVLLKYMIHNGPIERIIEVRDNGVPLVEGIGYMSDNSLGTFWLLHPPVGIITCSAQGYQKTINAYGNLTDGYAYTVGKIIQLIITQYGENKILPAGIDLNSFLDFEALHPMAVGLYINNNTNVISACQDLADSVGAQFTSTRTGLVTLLKINIPTTTAGSKSITDNSIIQNELAISAKSIVRSAVKLGYCKNYTIQTTLLTGIPEANKLLFTEQYLLLNVVDEGIKTLYKQSAEPEIKNTLMITNSAGHVTTEATRLLNLWKVPRFTFRISCTADFLPTKLGEMVKLTHNRFGLQSTKSGQVISLETNWDTGRVTMEVLV